MRRLLAAGLLLRLLLIAAGAFQPAMRWEYDALVEHLLAGQGLLYEHLYGVPYRAYTSGLPYLGLLALSRALSPADLGVQLAQTALALVSAWCAADLARALAGPRAALAAAALTLFHPGLVFYDVAQVHPLGLDTALGLSSLAALRRAWAGGARAAGLAGVVLGLALLQRPSLAPFAVFALVALWRLAPRRALACALAAAAVVAPWLVRNTLLFGRPLMATTTAEHFYVGNAPGSTGGNLSAEGSPVLAQLPPAVGVALAASDELEQAAVFRALGARLVRHDPLGFARGVLLKLARFWTLAPHTGLRYPAAFTWLHLAFYLPLLALALPAAWRLRADPTVRHACALCLGVSLVHACLYFELRHRFALEPLLAVLAAARFDLPRRGS